MRKPELSIALIQVLRRAAWQARALGHSYVGTEHFLLSLLTAERAGGVLRSLGWEECTLRSVLLLERGRGSRAVPLVQAYSPLARSAIGAAAHEAAALRAADVRPEHLLLALHARGSLYGGAVCCVGRARISTASFPMPMRSARRLCRSGAEKGSQATKLLELYCENMVEKASRNASRSSGARREIEQPSCRFCAGKIRTTLR